MEPGRNELRKETDELIDAYFESVQQLPLDVEQGDFDQTAVHKRIRDSIGPTTAKSRPTRPLNMWLYGSVAAIIVFFFFINLLYRVHPENRPMLVQQAATGSISKMKLPDGSSIWLNAGSTLRYPETFAADRREVYLEGEAYFDVAADKERPFLIHSDRMTTEVLGTQFNVSAYKSSKTIKVTVISGKVAVYEGEKQRDGKKAQGLLLLPNEEMEYSKTKRYFEKKPEKVPAEEAIVWKDGSLRFKDTELSEVIERLERHYAIKIERDSALRCPVTVNFDQEPLEKVMDIVAQIVNGKITKTDKGYKITDATCL